MSMRISEVTLPEPTEEYSEWKAEENEKYDDLDQLKVYLRVFGNLGMGVY